MFRLSRWGDSSYETLESITRQKSMLSQVVDIVPDHSDAEIIVVHSKQKIGLAQLLLMPSAKLIVTTTSGHEHMSLPVLHAAGIRTLRMPLLRRDAVVETALGLLLVGTRRLHAFRHAAEEGVWSRGQLPTIQPLTLRGLCVGVVGYGVIGQTMVQVLQSLGATVIVVDPKGVPAALRSSPDVLSLASQVDAITLHCDLNSSSKNIVSEAVLRALPMGAILVNTARGGLLDEAASIRALEKGRLSYLGLDVFETEPCTYLSRVQSIRGLDLLPHAAGFHQNLLSDMTTQLLGICRAFTAGEDLPHELFTVSH